MAALEACSVRSLPKLTLWGTVPITGATAEAMEACCWDLTHLALDLYQYDWPTEPGSQGSEDAAEYHLGCVQLLTLCGPRLRELRLLGGVHQWQPSAFLALRRCTALTRLELKAGWRDPNRSGELEDGSEEYLGRSGRRSPWPPQQERCHRILPPA